MDNVLDFYKDKRVFLTGHTGFKGSWMCKMLTNAGAVVAMTTTATDLPSCRN